MSANTFGSRFQITSFGESHGTALGVVIDGCPAGIKWNQTLLLSDLARRRPGASAIVSQRQETDQPEILSGVFEDKTLGTPIAIIVRNQNAQSQDYEQIKNSPRAGHADDVWRDKFGISDHRGGGRSSGRETVARVLGGSVAKMFLSEVHPQLTVRGFASEIGAFRLRDNERQQFLKGNLSADGFSARFPSSHHQQVFASLKEAQAAGESWGGQAEIVVQGMPKGLGQPVFHKLKADLAAAIMSVGATAAFEIGAGSGGASQPGTEFHDASKTSPYGGVRGGISTGEDLQLKVSFKPTSSILDVAKKGRHDPCIVPRAIPVLEAMVALVLADHTLWMQTDRTGNFKS
jgi:chorismate synthase